MFNERPLLKVVAKVNSLLFLPENLRPPPQKKDRRYKVASMQQHQYITTVSLIVTGASLRLQF